MKTHTTPLPMSTTKKNLLMILKQQISELQPNIIQMNEEALLKQLAKQKVVYNLSKKSNQLELVYAYMALSEYYIGQQFYEPALKNLLYARQIKQTGDILFLLGTCYFKTKKISEAIKYFEAALKGEWIQPSLEHQKSSLLECVSYLQRIFFQKAQKNQEEKPKYQQKLINLSYEKVKLTQDLNQAKEGLIMSENYYYSLAMADLAEIFNQFGEQDLALSKIKTAISMIYEYGFSNDGRESVGTLKQYRQKLIEFYYFQFLIIERLGRVSDITNSLNQAMKIVRMRQQSDQNPQRLSKIEQEIYYQYIKNNLMI